MTDTEQKALALVNEVGRERKDATLPHFYTRANHHFVEALCRAIEQHEAFRQEVSDAVEKLGCWPDTVDLGRFIIAKPDPLVEAMADCGVDRFESWADQLRAAIEKRGGKIVWGEG